MGCHAWWSYDFDFGNPLLRILATGFEIYLNKMKNFQS
jgi:hypothetical protein